MRKTNTIVNMTLKKSLLGLLVAIATILATTSPLSAGVILNDFIPFEADIPACGDLVRVEGELHCLISITEDRAGRTHLHVLSHPTAISGISLYDGSEFIGMGANSFSLNAILPDGDGTATQVIRVILVGENGQVYVTLLEFHITVANGNVVAFFDRTREVVCL